MNRSLTYRRRWAQQLDWPLMLLTVVAGLALVSPHALGKVMADVETGHVEVNGLDIYYQTYGELDSSERPLLILHGSFMSAEAMAPLAIVALVTPFLEDAPPPMPKEFF